MKTLLHKIHLAVTENPNSHFIIVSGANDFFIRTFLEGMRPPIVPTQIISNHAELSQATPQTLIFRPYENQRTCPICPHFLCKGNQYFYGCLTREWIPNTKIVSSGGALRSYIDAHGPFTQVYYCADGCNDVVDRFHTLFTIISWLIFLFDSVQLRNCQQRTSSLFVKILSSTV